MPTIVVAMSRIPINIAELVGSTPLVGLPQMLDGTAAADNGVELFAKLEAFNPGGSVKDRIGVAMIEAAEAEGQDRARAHDDRRGHQRQHRASRSRSCAPPRATSWC